MSPQTEFFALGVVREKYLPGGDPKEVLFIISGTSWATNHEDAKGRSHPHGKLAGESQEQSLQDHLG